MIDTVPTPFPHVVWRETSDGVVLVDPRAGKVRVLNSVGSFIWLQLTGDNPTAASLIEAITDRYDVSAEQAAADVEQFVDELRRRGLVPSDA